MQVPYGEGVATHIGPQPRADVRKGAGEASAGECTGQPLSPEKILSRTPTSLRRRKAILREALERAPAGPAWSETLACADALCLGTGRSHVRPWRE